MHSSPFGHYITFVLKFVVASAFITLIYSQGQEPTYYKRIIVI